MRKVNYQLVETNNDNININENKIINTEYYDDDDNLIKNQINQEEIYQYLNYDKIIFNDLKENCNKIVINNNITRYYDNDFLNIIKKEEIDNVNNTKTIILFYDCELDNNNNIINVNDETEITTFIYDLEDNHNNNVMIFEKGDKTIRISKCENEENKELIKVEISYFEKDNKTNTYYLVEVVKEETNNKSNNYNLLSILSCEEKDYIEKNNYNANNYIIIKYIDNVNSNNLVGIVLYKLNKEEFENDNIMPEYIGSIFNNNINNYNWMEIETHLDYYELDEVNEEDILEVAGEFLKDKDIYDLVNQYNYDNINLNYWEKIRTIFVKVESKIEEEKIQKKKKEEKVEESISVDGGKIINNDLIVNKEEEKIIIDLSKVDQVKYEDGKMVIIIKPN